MDPRKPQKPPPGPSYLFKEATEKAALRVAEAENKEQLAQDAANEVQEIQKLIEEATAMLRLATEIYEKCLLGEIIHFAAGTDDDDE